MALHKRESLDAYQEAHHLSSTEVAERLKRLEGAGLVREWQSGAFLPTFMVVTANDARRYLPVAQNVVAKTTTLIETKLAEIEHQIGGLPGFGGAPSGLVRFFVLSDVLLDNWQIRAVERDWLKAARPIRDGKAFYLSLMERRADQRDESFGLYGNTGTARGDVEVNVYGRARYSAPTLMSATASDLRQWFPTVAGLNDEELEREIVTRTIQLGRAGSSDSLGVNDIEGFRGLGLLDGRRINVLVLPRDTSERLDGLAAVVRPELVKILKDHLPQLRKAFAQSPYAKEITLEEYAIWWYHFFYTKVTDSLATHGFLAIPASGNVTYLVMS